MASRRVGGWKNGRMEEWKVGRVEEWNALAQLFRRALRGGRSGDSRAKTSYSDRLQSTPSTLPSFHSSIFRMDLLPMIENIYRGS
jgi:hypothetical protein